MDVYMDIRSMVGNTPVLKLNHLGIEGISPKVNIYAKLELMNPGGSIKDRVGIYMIDDAVKRGILKPGELSSMPQQEIPASASHWQL